MTVKDSKITGAERDAILTLEEDHFSDLKAVQVTPEKLSKTLSAFANASGGELYVGIGESEFFGSKERHWKGFKDQEAANGHLQSLEELFPLGADYSYEFLRAPGSPGLVLLITVQKTHGITNARNRTPYVRRGAQNIPVSSAAALERLRLDKGIESFERQPVDIDLRIVEGSGTICDFVDQVVPTTTPPAFLKKQSLVLSGKPVVAGVLLFADEPQAALPKRSAIKLTRYKGSEGEGTRDTLVGQPMTIEGPVYNLIGQAVQRTTAMVQGIQRLGTRGLEPVTYPPETLHEIVTNAVLHRDYSIASDIHIRVFDNRIEIESPGKLPGHVTVRNILDEQFARNPAVVRLINKFPNPPNKDIGEGLNTAFEAMLRLRLKSPVIEESESSVIVKIGHAKLAAPEESVMDYLENHDMITNRIARQLTGITSENSMKEVFYRLAKSHLIERVPGRLGAAAAWQKANGASKS